MNINANSEASTSVSEILFILREFAIGGLERVVLSQIELALGAGFSVTVAVLNPQADNALIAELDEKVTVLPLPKNPVKRCKALIRASSGHQVFLHFGYGALYPLVRLPLRLRSKNVIRFCHSDYAHRRNVLVNLVDRLMSRLDDRVVTVGGGAHRFCVEDVRLPEHKMLSLPNAVAPERTLMARRRLVRLITVADFDPHKNQSAVVAAFAALAKQNPTVSLTMVGAGPEMLNLWLSCQALDCLDRVEWLGAVWNERLIERELEASTIFVSMSRREGVPISVLEARRANLTLVLSDIPGHRVAGGPDAVYVPLDDYAGLVSALESCCANELLRSDLSDRREARSSVTAIENDWLSFKDGLLHLLD